jgi:Tfp pilus assembly protein PilV
MHLESEDGMGVIDLLVAVTVLTIALLALVAGFDVAASSVHEAAQKTAAATLADTQLEIYSSLPFASIGLDATTLANVQTSGNGSYDGQYVSDEAALNAASSGTDVTISGCGATANCSPVQNLVGADRHTYKLETFIRDIVSFGTWTERTVTVIVRDSSRSGSPEVLRLTAGFDRGP